MGISPWLVGGGVLFGIFLIILEKDFFAPRRLRRKIEQCATSKEARSLQFQASWHSTELGELAWGKIRELEAIEQEQEFERSFNDALGSEEKLVALLDQVTWVTCECDSFHYPLKYAVRVQKELRSSTEERIIGAKKSSELLALNAQHRINDSNRGSYECSLAQFIIEETIAAVNENDECFAIELLDGTSLGKLVSAKKNMLGTNSHSRADILKAIDSALRYELTVLWGN